MDEWTLLCALCDRANVNEQDKLARLITGNDFEGKGQAQDAAIIGFEITPLNVIRNKDAAVKLASFKPTENWGLQSTLRQNLIKQLLDEITG